MGPAPLRSDSCNTCRKRKVKVSMLSTVISATRPPDWSSAIYSTHIARDASEEAIIAKAMIV
ncbi:hypothetical protein N7462_003070 [Penicillium macrosclerotiorum]|uniref:uncharacterized protein n=1 Tax=Penicillium macrosclerotiorum TaxID=303699 RepID=UPI00254831A3|nr:uncharacterized protein N7462_003070 [Penicillium macrosclerotiorum]KAJ5688678.1 hypothetical protein N7462_003070 [Penicillium macrosclerotiorum]